MNTNPEAITAAKKLGPPMPHTVIVGPPGMGQSTLSRIAARETSPPAACHTWRLELPRSSGSGSSCGAGT